jgi:LPS export ABC transporter protein LptC
MRAYWDRFQHWFTGILFFVVILELTILAPKGLNNSQTQGLEKKNDITGADNTQQIMRGVHVVETKKEKREWELWASQAIGLRDSGDMKLETVRAEFFTDQGESFVVTGKTGEVDSQSKNVKIQGEVVTKSSNGYAFQSDYVFYESNKKSLSTDAAVRVDGPRGRKQEPLHLSGVGMVTDLRAGEMKILKNVKAKQTLAQTGRMNIESSLAVLSNQAKEMRFDGGVIIDFSGVRVRGPTAQFLYDAKKEAVSQVRMDGGVQLSDWNKMATAERVNIDLVNNKYVFNGSPKIVQDTDEVMGDEIVFLNGGKKVKIKNARVKVSKDTLRKTN